MDYAQRLLTPKGSETAIPFDWATELTKPKTIKSPADIEIANQGDTKGTAGFGTLVKGGMVEDPQTKIDVFAKARFPGLPLESARSRYGIIDGEVVYVGGDDKVYRETPSGFVGGAKRMAADVVSNAPAVIGGTVGAVAGAGAGPAASAGLAALGAAGGKGYGRVAAGMAFDEPQTTAGNVASMAKEAAFTGAGTLIGNYLGKVLSGAKARDIAKLDLSAVAEIDRKAAAEGINLDVAQRTNLPSMKSRYDALASMPTSRGTIADFAQMQSGQANVAANRFLEKVSPVAGLDEAGTMARDATGKVLKMLTEERAAAASPLYKQAFSEFKGLPAEVLPEVTELFSRPSMKTASRVASRIAKDEGIDLADPTKSLIGMHYMKIALDKMVGDEAKGSLAATSRRALLGLKENLVTIMDDASPKDQAGEPIYRQARGIFAHFSPNIESVKEGVISRISDLPDEKVAQAAKMMFNPDMSPSAITRARELFNRAGRGEDWDALLRAYLQENFSKAGREFATAGGELGQSVRWRAMLYGDPAQRRVIHSAMTAKQRDAYLNMMDVLEAMGRTYGVGGGSQTMPRQEAAKVLRDEAVGTITKAITPVSSLKTWLQEVTVGRHAEKMAEIMTSPDGIQKLKELVKMSPTSEKFISGASSLFSISSRPESRPDEEQVPAAAQ